MSGKVNLAKRPIVDLRKDAGRSIRRRNLGGLQMDIEVVLDRSGSMEDEYQSGLVQRVLDRCYALCAELDPDGQMPVTLFHNSAKQLSELTAQNVDNYVQTHISREPYGGTSYAPPLEQILRRRRCEKSFLGKVKPAQRPVMVLLITDGVNDDAHATARVMQELSKEAPVFVKFIGLDTGANVRFTTLERLDDMSGRSFDNADFFRWDSSLNDDGLYDALLNEVASAMNGMKKVGLLA
jgi:hypothetical protein